MAATWLLAKFGFKPEDEPYVDAFMRLAEEKNFSQKTINDALEFASRYQGKHDPNNAMFDPTNVIFEFENFMEARGTPENYRNECLGWYSDTKLQGLAPPPAIDAETVQTDSELKMSLESLMADPRSEYWRGAKSEELQRLYFDIIERRERSVNATAHNKAAEKTNSNIARIAELQTLMADSRGKYWKGDEAEALQREYRGLIEQRDMPPHPTNETMFSHQQIAPAQAATEGTNENV